MKHIYKVLLALLLCISSLSACTSKPVNGVYNETGTYDKEETLVSAEVSSDGVIISNKVIEGDLSIHLSEGQSVTLNNVTVKGNIIIENDALAFIDSIFTTVHAASDAVNVNLFDVTCNEIEVKKVKAYIVASGATNINLITTDANLDLVEQSLSKNGFNDVTVQGNKDILINALDCVLRSVDINSSGETTINTSDKTTIEMLNVKSFTRLNGPASIQVAVLDEILQAADATFDTIVDNYGQKNEEVTTTTTTSEVVTTKVTTTTKKTTTKKPATTTTTKKPVVTTTTTTTRPVVTTTTTTTKKNTAPVITAEDVTILVDKAFNPLTGVTIYDAEDGSITPMAKHIKKNTVNTSKTGTYYVTYSVTDSQGLTTTLERKVVVTRQLDTPQNVSAVLNNNGDLLVSWDDVDNARYYIVNVGKGKDIYVNGSKTSTVIELVSKETDEVENEEKEEYKYYLDTDTTIYVYAEPKDTEEYKTSSAGKATFKPLKVIENVPTKLTASNTATSFTYRIPESGISNKASAKIVMSYMSDEDDNTYNMKNKTIGEGITLGSNGMVEVDYDRSTGLLFNYAFKNSGTYELTITIIDDKETVSTESFEIYVKPGSSSSSSSSSYPKPVIVSYDVASRFVDGTTVTFKLKDDLDLTKSLTDLRIIVEYYTDSFYEEIMSKASSYTCPYTQEVLEHGTADSSGYYTYKCNYGEEEGTVIYKSDRITSDKYINAGDEYSFNISISNSSAIYELLSAGYEVAYTVTVQVTDKDGEKYEVTTKKAKFTFEK